MFALKACKLAGWVVAGGGAAVLFLANASSAGAGGSVPVVTSTATPPPCVTPCRRVQPDVIALLDPVRPGVTATSSPKSTVIFLPKTNLVVSKVVEFPHEVDVELTAGGNHQTIHLPFSVRPKSAVLHFPTGAKLDSVIGLGTVARILYGSGTPGTFNRYTVSGPPFMTATTVQCSGLRCVRPVPRATESRAL